MKPNTDFVEAKLDELEEEVGRERKRIKKRRGRNSLTARAKRSLRTVLVLGIVSVLMWQVWQRVFILIRVETPWWALIVLFAVVVVVVYLGVRKLLPD